jgi:hypothetical protein
MSSYGLTTICRYINGYQRTNTTRAQNRVTPTNNQQPTTTAAAAAASVS